ncbi:hypothetical protein BX666DRAFT_631966 [Dichotomocladium elegans]|nr:hypothetical protein BX666DRAFT_631966 [Dichotomocladium elegans]
MMEVPQHLDPEQVRYEFPPRSRLEQLAQYYDADISSFLDESSFTSTSTPLVSYLNDHGSDARAASASAARTSQSNYSVESLERFFHSIPSALRRSIGSLDDSNLSPLQLPATCHDIIERSRPRERSCDSLDTVTQCNAAVNYLNSRNGVVGPVSFLDCPSSSSSIDRDYRPRVQSNELLPVFRSESELHNEDSMNVIVIRLSRTKPPLTLVKSHHSPRRCSSKQAWSAKSDEGYIDDGDELPMQSASLFLPLSDQEQEQLTNSELLRTFAATKIQAAWRGYQYRKAGSQNGATSSGMMTSTNKLLAKIASMCGTVHHRQMGIVRSRLNNLDLHLQEETAMRIAFEKAMEGMTVLIDQQHRVLYERIEHEITLRERYERKMDEALARIQPLELQLRKEVMARSDIESMMTCVLEQIHDLKRDARADAESRRKIQAQLDEAREEITKLKKYRSVTPEMRTRAAMLPSQHQQYQHHQHQIGINPHKPHVGEKRSVSAMAAAPPRATPMTLRRTTPIVVPSRANSHLETKRSMPVLTSIRR